jgi:hypothetical protein
LGGEAVAVSTVKRPTAIGWREVPTPTQAMGHGPIEIATFENALGIRVISAIEDAGKGPEFHVSISYRGTRAPRAIMQIVRRAFDMQRAEEDNHVRGGVVRHLWFPCNQEDRACDCADELTIVTPFGGNDETGDEFVFREEPAR